MTFYNNQSEIINLLINTDHRHTMSTELFEEDTMGLQHYDEGGSISLGNTLTKSINKNQRSP